MNIIEKTFIDNHTLHLKLSVKLQAGFFVSPRIVIGGLVECQFRAELNLKYNINNRLYEYRIITLHEKFSLVDEGMNITPIIRSRFLGLKTSDVKKEDKNIMTTTNNIWHLRGTTTAEEYKSEYVIKFIITIEDWSLKATPFDILHEDTTITDFELSGQDGSIIVHKAVLAASSPMLNTMLSGQWKEATNGKLELAGVTKETLTDLKAFMYLKKLPSITEEEEEEEEDEDEKDSEEEEENEVEQIDVRLEELLKLACYLLMPDLAEACSALLLLNLTKENAHKLINLAGMYKIKILSKGLFFSYQQQSVDFTGSSIFPGDWI